MPVIDLSDVYTSRQMLLLQYQGKSNIIWYVVNKPLSTHTRFDFQRADVHIMTTYVSF